MKKLFLLIPVLLFCCYSCKKEPSTTNGVNFDLDLNESANAPLKQAGGYIITHNILVIHFLNNYFATASKCSFDSSLLSFNDTTARIVCPLNTCKYDINGEVKNGPTTTALKHYNAVLIGTTLSITGN